MTKSEFAVDIISDDDKDPIFHSISESDDLNGGEEHDFCDKTNKEEIGSRDDQSQKDDVTRDIRGNVIMRQFVCNRERLRNKKHFMRVDRKREHRPLTRTSCQAKLRVHYHHNSLKWKVVSFEQCHNHELTPSRYVHLPPAYRGLTDCDKAQVDRLHGHGLRGCHIMGYLVAQKGGYCRVGFTKKDMYNYLDRKNQAYVKKGYVRAALSYLQDFKRAMYSNFTPTEFDEFWKKKVVEHGLEGNKWVSKTYENKELWATAYLRDKFFGRIRTTSQCESINSFIRSYCKKKSSMVEFLHKFEQAKNEYKNNELMADFKTLFSEPVLTTYLRSIEKEASNIYTQEIFREVKQEIEKANALMVCERSMLDDHVMFSLKKFCSPGIPCSHIITVMRNEDMENIPKSLICKRWLKTAKIDLMSHYDDDETDSDVMEEACYAAVSAACNNFAKVASKKRNYLKEILEDIRKLTIKYEKLEDKVCKDGNPTVEEVGDPSTVKTKEKAENCELPPMVPKGKEMSQEKKAKHSKEPAYNIASSSKGVKFENSQVSPPVQPMAPPMHFPSNGYGSFNQGYPIFPNFSGSPIQTQHNAVPVYGHNMHYPFYHHNDQLPIYPQGPQVMKSGDQRSGYEEKR
ncbi:FAR1 DNA-binding domain [Sesbania bispinosa]|nr:FAR1 DNA-binding domain [Sesbania bispinosa]